MSRRVVVAGLMVFIGAVAACGGDDGASPSSSSSSRPTSPVATVPAPAGTDAPAGEVGWLRTFGTDQMDDARAVAVAADGTIYVTGSTTGNLDGTLEGDMDPFLRAYSASGQLVWGIQPSAAPTGSEGGADLAVTPAGDVVLVSVVDHADPGWGYVTGHELVVRRVSPSGAVVGERRLTPGEAIGRGPAGESTIWDVAVNGSGAIAVVGFVATQEAPLGDTYVRLYRPDGALAWTLTLRELVEPNSTGGWSSVGAYAGVAIGETGDVYVTEPVLADPDDPNSGWDVLLHAYRSDGTERWAVQFGAHGPDTDDFASGIDVGRDGVVAVAGATHGALAGPVRGGRDSYVEVFGVDGSLLWGRQLGLQFEDAASAVAVGDDGTVVVTGGQAPSDLALSPSRSFVRQFGEAGDLISADIFGGRTLAAGVAVGPDGTVAVAGTVLVAFDTPDFDDAFVRTFPAVGVE